MASTYALPAASMTHSHHGHVHTHSHSPIRPATHVANTPRSVKQEHRASASLHTHAHSESHGHNYNHNHNHNHSHGSHLPTPPNSDRTPAFVDPFVEKPAVHDHKHSGSTGSSYLPPPNNTLGHNHTHDHSQHEHDHEHDHDHDHDHSHDHGHDHDYKHDHSHSGHSHGTTLETRSRFTSAILPLVKGNPLLHTILAEKDSRRIFYFMSLNFAFMVVQAFYGYITDSLGLLSDSIHMFFDCLALAVGLFAAVASRWPPSQRFPYGFGKIETLSGFGNGIFLMLISIEILIEATERLAEGHETKRLTELFVVSSLGLAVNLVGMACFGHHHHGGQECGGHDHGHSHDHTHSHSHSETHSHSHSHSHDHSNFDAGNLLSAEPKPAAAHSHDHGHSHDNENMQGIFLHVLADTMGSAAVIVSTLLIHFVGWSGWDPIASCVIAILIFLSSIPLVKSSAKKLLLTVPDNTEYNLRETLASVSGLRGVASYSGPHFWMGDKSVGSDGEQVLGVIHIQATRGSDLEDVRVRTRILLLSRGVDAVVQVEAFGDTSCWCGGNSVTRSPSRYSGS